MRPAPQARHAISVLIFAAVSAAYGYFAFMDQRLSETQINIASAAVKRHQGDMYTCDPVLGKNGLWRLHTPVFYGLLELVLFPTGYKHPALPFRVMTGIAAMVYLCGMYALMYRQCRSWSVAAFTAVLSTAVTEALGGAWWGIGSLATITPMGVCIALTPLVVLALLQYSAAADAPKRHQWRLLIIFACIGLMGNLQLVAAANLTIVLLIAYLGRMRFRASSLSVAVGCGVAAFVGALPYIVYFLTLRARLSPANAPAYEGLVYEALRMARAEVLYPELAEPLLDWLIFVAALSVPAGAVLIRFERFKVRELSFWVWFIIGGLLVSLGLHGLGQLTGALRQTTLPMIPLLQASALVMLPLYVLLAQAVTNLFRLVTTHRWVIFCACGVAMVIWLLPSDNFRPLRHKAYDAATAFREPADKPLRVQQLHAKRDERAELSSIADWARQTDRNSVFITRHTEFRMLAGRSIVVHPEDVRYYYYLAPWRLGTWIDRLESQAKLFQKPPHMSELIQFRRGLSQHLDFAEATDWYAIVPAKLYPTGGERSEVRPADEWAGKWGKHYRLFMVPPAASLIVAPAPANANR